MQEAGGQARSQAFRRPGLRAKGAGFTCGISEESFGRTAKLNIPGAGEMLLYRHQPTHPPAYNLGLASA